MEISEKVLSQLTDEQKKMIETAKTPEDILAVARETGYELSQEQLNDLSGGGWYECSEYDDTWCRDFVNM